MSAKDNIKQDLAIYFSFAVLATIFLYLFSYGTSWLFPTYGGDSGIFIVVGKAMVKGKILYKDIFDHKGPILFFINALGYSLGGIKGIFFIQIINLTIIQILIYRITLLFQSSRLLALIPVAGMYILFASSIDDGDVSEEYSIPFVLYSLYVFIKYILSGNDKHPPIYALIYGASLMVIALIRLNNGVAIGCIILAILIQLLREKQYQNLLQNILYFLLGSFIVFALTSIYFIINGAFGEFIYATFTFNFKYSGAYPRPPWLSQPEIIKHITSSFATILLYITLIIYRKKLNTTFIIASVLIGIFTVISIRIGGSLIHYQMLNIVPWILSLILIIQIVKDKDIKQYLKVLSVVLALLLGAYNAYVARRIIFIYSLSHNTEELYNSFAMRIDKKYVHSIIPLEERNSVYAYNVRAGWFLETDILPSYKYFTNQELWIMVDKEEVYGGINNYLETTPPLWIVLPQYHQISWMKGLEDNTILKSMIENDYHLVGRDTDYLYYRYK